MKKLFTLGILILLLSTTFAQSDPPKREFRGIWVASVANLDWPRNPFDPVSKKKQDLIDMLDEFKVTNINAVLFQVRPECDALYDSQLEPWSYWLTGSQGTAPSPYFDPLQFAIEETHKRGMELHAWFNPYRAVRSVGSYPVSSDHVSIQHPDWILTFGSLKILDPGIPDVRDYNTSIIMDVVNRYDIDGVHFDDYFYPYPPNQISNQDLQTFQTYPNGFTNIGDWRRNNVNMQMLMIHDSIKAVKPHVKFGISPFGIWKNGVPPGITGMNAYDVIYADPIAWLHDRSVDYLTPQLYWRIGGGQDYNKLMPWWADSVYANDRHFYPGHIFGGTYSVFELPAQLRLDRANPKTTGGVWFKATNLNANDLNFEDSLRQDYYRYKALPPVMNWIDTIPPNTPPNVTYNRIAGTGVAGFTWDLPPVAADGDTAFRYVVYRFEDQNIQPEDLDDPANIFEVEGKRLSMPAAPGQSTGNAYFVITALDRMSNESDMSAIVTVEPPATPVLAYPSDGSVDQPDTLIIGWNYPVHSSAYTVQLSKSSDFSVIEQQITGVTDTFAVVTNLDGLETYYWRVVASNAAGISGYSQHFSFTTGFPLAPQLVYPTNNTGGFPLNVSFEWNSSTVAQTYRFDLAKSRDFTTGSMVLSETGLADTTYSPGEDLELNRFYFWRVGAENILGFSGWSDTFAFKTTSVSLVPDGNTIPTEYSLNQNYPNPFNPSTIISFGIPESGFTTLRVYNLLGQQVAELIAEDLSPGNYSVEFDGSGLTSGIYVYILKSRSKIFTSKMMLVK